MSKERAEKFLKENGFGCSTLVRRTLKSAPLPLSDLLQSFAKQEVGRACKEPFKCPVCLGKGKLPHSFYIISGQGATSSISDVTCKTCNGATIIYTPHP